ncbi:polysaccharide pyruvyl transferase family protein [Janibacter cremeus]|uniref:Polysaccharide pyruvyl transferase WcaK-like protein n=1 Tax=Janibacter cremeus TaxID=1285192 RepID=A0A852VZ91_9MICO|nr:polysaccharide pyruvyl transferase family protein [Janibacter cremeus]NYF99035.1 polysaccharide pyruvyl transferase WcaK-like protein [Janibacter cremeus]
MSGSSRGPRDHTGIATGLRLVLAGASLGTGNRGVEALARAVIDSIGRDSADAALSVLDDGWGVRAAPAFGARSDLVGVRWSRRWHRPESWARIRLAQALGRADANPAAARFAAADAVLDLSGGDSFTDLYGPARLAAVSAPKRAAIRAGRPLVLLPQTYGPFTTSRGRTSAERIIRSSSVAFARDPWSHEQLLSLAGPDADHTRLRRGVDVAFGLEARRPTEGVAEQVEQWTSGLTAGVNVSGLLLDSAARTRFALAGDYLATMTQLVRGLLAAEAQVVFVPHVHSSGGVGESDMAAIRRIREQLSSRERSRTRVVPPDLDARELKWCISRLDWFVGSRMHSTIAALSTLTPAAAYAYSDKASGVFETCGMRSQVVDARQSAGGEAVDAILTSFNDREVIRADLAAAVPPVVEESRTQLRDLLTDVGRWRDSGGTAEPIV